MKTFQKPLTPEEESRYLQEYKQGSLQAKDILIERNLRLVAHIVKKYQGAPEELDDLISIGTIGLIKAVQTFDAKKASRLSTYAARCIDNELLMYFLLYRLIPQILTQREQEIIKFRYGLYGQQEQTQREIAKRLNISRSYVSRIEKNAVLKLRSYFPSS